MFKKILALLLATMMVLGGMVTVAAEEAEAPVEEVVDTVDYDAIYAASADKLAALDILKGNGVDYALDDYVQRWHMALFVARIMSGETKDEFWNEVADNTTKFDDVDNYFGAIDYVSERGIVKGKGWIPGVGSNCFAPNESIILQDALTMVVRALGYKQLENYPDDFVAKAEALGLTAGLEELDLTAPLTRGQMVQILNNTLFTEIDGTSFAKANFGLEEQTYVIVATEFQALAGAKEVVRVDYLENSAKYVALAPLNADGTYDFDNLYYFTEEELGLDAGTSEQKLGYSYTATSFDGFTTVASIDENYTETYYNYGFDAEDLQIVAGTKYSQLKDSTIVKINNKTYRLVDTYTELSNKPTYANKQPELIVHSMFEDQESAEYVFLYDLQGNILNPADVKEDGTLGIGIYYTLWNNTYYVFKDGGYQVATEDDFAQYSIGEKSDAKYGIVETASQLTEYKYAEIVMIDDNGDDVFDRAIYTPYSIGYYENYYDADNKRLVLYDKAGNTKNDKKLTYVRINGVPVNADFYNGTEVIGSFDYINAAAVNFIYEDGSVAPKNNELIIYNYNKYSRTLRIIENLGTPVEGNLDNYKQGSVAWDAVNQKFVVTSGKVIIDNVEYSVGLSDTYDSGKLSTTYAAFGVPFAAIDNKFNVINDVDYKLNNGNMSYLNQIHTIMFNGDPSKTVKYQLLDNRVIILNDTDYDTTASWVLFDYGYSTTGKATGGYTKYDYKGDILGVDENYMIEVNGYDSKHLSGTKSTIKIDKINGQSFGYLVEDYAILRYQFSGVGFVTTGDALETMKKIIIKDFFTSLTGDLNEDVDEVNPENNKRQFLFRVESVNDDGSYNIRTDVDTYWGAENVWKWSQPAVVEQYSDMSFEYGFSTTKTDKKAGEKFLVTNNNTKVVIAGKNSIDVYTGKLNDATIDFTENVTYTYALSNDLIIIVAPSVDNPTTILQTAWTPDVSVKDGWTYYMVYGAGIADGTTISKYTYTTNTYEYKNLYNINKGTLETKTVVGGLEDYNETQDIFKLDELYAVYGTAKPVGAIYANKGDAWVLLTNEASNTLIKASKKEVANCFVVDNSKQILGKILGQGVEGYPAVYSEVGTISGKAGFTNMIMLNGNKEIDTITFAYDIIEYKTGDNAGSIAVSTDKASTTDAKGVIYYDYTEHVKFTGTLIKGETTKYEPVVTPEVPETADEARAEAAKQINAIVLVTLKKADADALAASERALMAAAKTPAEVYYWMDEIIDIIKDADAEATTEATDETALRNEYLGKFAELKESDLYKNFKAALLPSGATVEAHVTAWTADSVKNDAVAYPGAAIKQNYELAVQVLEAAKAADKTIVISGANSITTDNLYKAKAIWVYKLVASQGYVELGSFGSAYEGLGDLAGATLKYDATKFDADKLLTYTVEWYDAAGKLITDKAPVFEAGETYLVKVQDKNGTYEAIIAIPAE